MSYKNLIFSLFPAGGVGTASSRIRIYTFQLALEKLGIATVFGYSLRANVLYFQKRVTRENIWQARIAKAMGRTVIYDIDDLGDALWYWVGKSDFTKMLRLADFVTACSQAQLEFLQRTYGVTNGHVIYPAIDYFPQQPVRRACRDGDPLRIAWFGSSSNIGLLEKHLPALLQIRDAEILAIVNQDAVTSLSRKHPAVHFIPWSLGGVVSDLQSCDIVCLMHDGSEEDRAKGNNKMIAAITWGVPAIVSNTPEYQRTAREAGIEYAVFSGDQELCEVVERLRSPVARNHYLEVAQDAIWRRYSPDAIARNYLELISGLRKTV